MNLVETCKAPKSVEWTDAEEKLESKAYTVERIPRPETVGNQIIWSYLIPFTLFHAMIPLAFVPYFFSWTGVILLPLGHVVFNWLGIGLCFHRVLTHGGLVLPKWLERTFAVFGVFTLMDSPARWVAVHRKHHHHSDDQPDPHSPMVTFWWGHMEWLYRENEEMSDIDFYHKYAPDILRDRFYLTLERYHLWAWVYVAHAIVYFFAGLACGRSLSGNYWGGLQFGLSLVLWGVIFRTLFTWHSTFAVNSVAHRWGYRNYDTRDNSQNNWIVAALTGGEGWHNNHHAHPVSSMHGHRWWEFDPTYLAVRILALLGLAREVKTHDKNT